MSQKPVVNIKVNESQATLTLDRMLTIGSVYQVVIEGANVDNPQFVITTCDGAPVAKSEPDGTLSLDSSSLWDQFPDPDGGACCYGKTFRAYVTASDYNVAQGAVAVKWAPFEFDPMGEPVTMVGPPGPPGRDGADGKDGEPGRNAVYEDSSLFAFQIDEHGDLIVRTQRAGDFYGTDADGNIDTDKPLWRIDENGNLLWNPWVKGFGYGPFDVGHVAGAIGPQGPQGEQGIQGPPGPPGPPGPSGGGGTGDYNDLANKPAIDGNALTSDSTAAGLGLATLPDLPYALHTVTDGVLADRSVNILTAGGTLTFPTATEGKAREFLVSFSTTAGVPPVKLVGYGSLKSADPDVWKLEQGKEYLYLFSEVAAGAFVVGRLILVESPVPPAQEATA